MSSWVSRTCLPAGTGAGEAAGPPPPPPGRRVQGHQRPGRALAGPCPSVLSVTFPWRTRWRWTLAPENIHAHHTQHTHRTQHTQCILHTKYMHVHTAHKIHTCAHSTQHTHVHTTHNTHVHTTHKNARTCIPHTTYTPHTKYTHVHTAHNMHTCAHSFVGVTGPSSLFLDLTRSFDTCLLTSSRQPGANWAGCCGFTAEKESPPAECTAKSLGVQWSPDVGVTATPRPHEVALPSHREKAVLPRQVAGGTAPSQPQAEHGPWGSCD